MVYIVNIPYSEGTTVPYERNNGRRDIVPSIVPEAKDTHIQPPSGTQHSHMGE